MRLLIDWQRNEAGEALKLPLHFLQKSRPDPKGTPLCLAKFVGFLSKDGIRGRKNTPAERLSAGAYCDRSASKNLSGGLSPRSVKTRLAAIFLTRSGDGHNKVVFAQFDALFILGGK